MLIFSIVKYAYSFSNIDSSVNVAECCRTDIQMLYQDLNYFSVIAFIVFTLYKIKQRKFFRGHPVVQTCSIRQHAVLLLQGAFCTEFCLLNSS